MRIFPTSLMAAVLICSLFGCEEETDADAEMARTEVLYFEPLGYGQAGTLTDTTKLAIRSEEEWATYRDSLRPVAPFRPVDFSQSIVVLVALPQTTSGHSIEIVTVEERDSVTVVEYIVSIPSDDCLTASAETVPFHAVMVRATDLPVRFAHETEEYRCTFGPRR